MKTNHLHPNTLKVIAATALTALAIAGQTSVLRAQDQGSSPPSQSGNSPGGEQAGPPHHPGGPHLLPPHAAEKLNLTDEQKKQLADLEAEVRVKIKSILTPEQLEQLRQMRPPHPGSGPEGPNQSQPAAQSSTQSTP